MRVFFLNIELGFLENKNPYNVDLIKDKEGQKKDSPIKNTDESTLVAGTGLEPVTFGL